MPSTIIFNNINLKTKIKLLLVPIAFIIALSCSGNEASMKVRYDKKTTWADGVSKVEIKSSLYWNDSLVSDSVNVIFSSSAGRFSNDGSEIKKSLSVSSEGGSATAILFAPGKEAIANISIVAEIGGKTLNHNSKVQFKRAPIENNDFEFNCDQQNFGALANSQAELPCTIKVTNPKTGKENPLANIKFISETGEMLAPTKESFLAKQEYFYKFSANKLTETQAMANLGEPSRGNKNPRDRLVTIVALTEGQESFQDFNGNGEFDENDILKADLPEPWVDSNDNGQFDQDETYFDTNRNARYDFPNGQWDGKTTLFKVVHILVTGEPDPENSEIITDGGRKTYQLRDKETKMLKIKLLDDYLNPVAASKTGSDDSIQLNLEGPGSLDNNGSIKLQNSFPFSFMGEPWGEGKVVGYDKQKQYKTGIYTSYHRLSTGSQSDEEQEFIITGKASFTPVKNERKSVDSQSFSSFNRVTGSVPAKKP